jgi:hypothetical protein
MFLLYNGFRSSPNPVQNEKAEVIMANTPAVFFKPLLCYQKDIIAKKSAKASINNIAESVLAPTLSEPINKNREKRLWVMKKTPTVLSLSSYVISERSIKLKRNKAIH